jgi:hypothetical protein
MSVHLRNPKLSDINVNSLIFGHSQVERNIVESIIHHQADAIVEQLLDCQEDIGEELTRREILEHFGRVKASAGDLIDDMLADLGVSLKRALDQALITPVITGMQFEPASGLVENVDVVLDVKFSQ